MTALLSAALTLLAPLASSSDGPRPGDPQPGAVPTPAARILAEELAVGRLLEVSVTFEDAPDAWWGDPTEVTVSRPILQIDAPDGVVLLGAAPVEKERARDYETEYLRFPYGRKLYEAETRIGLRLDREPRPEDRVGLNFILWLDGADPARARFVRRRLELPLVAGADAVPGDSNRTSWGVHETLTVGEPADLFALPAHDDTTVELESLRGAPALVLTYRAHW